METRDNQVLAATGWEFYDYDGLAMFLEQTEEVQQIVVWWLNKRFGVFAGGGRQVRVRVALLRETIRNAPEYAIWRVREEVAALEGKTLLQVITEDGGLGLHGGMSKHLGLLGD